MQKKIILIHGQRFAWQVKYFLFDNLYSSVFLFTLVLYFLSLLFYFFSLGGSILFVFITYAIFLSSFVDFRIFVLIFIKVCFSLKKLFDHYLLSQGLLQFRYSMFVELNRKIFLQMYFLFLLILYSVFWWLLFTYWKVIKLF